MNTTQYCKQCHAGLGLNVVKLSHDEPKQFCSQQCAESWERDIVKMMDKYEPVLKKLARE